MERARANGMGKGSSVSTARAIPAGRRSFTRGLSGSEANAHEYGDPPIKGRKKRRRRWRELEGERRNSGRKRERGTRREGEREPGKSW